MSCDSDSDWSDIVEDEDVDQSVTALCLFCKEVSLSAELCFDHIQIKHGTDIKEMLKNKKMDFYQYIKFINFIRQNKPLPSTVVTLKSEDYNSDQWLMPVIADDLLLQFDVENILVGSPSDGNCKVEEADLSTKLAFAEERAKIAEQFLERSLGDLNECRKELNSLLLGKTVNEEKQVGDKGNTSDGDGEAYFGSYAHFSIHEEMLKDEVRTDSYKNFILNNPDIFKDAKVLDVGCGTSVLSMFAAKAGAGKVVGVDYSEVAYQAMDIVKENNLAGIIEIVKGKAEDVNLKEKVDVIISEWMGYFLLFESMLDTVLYCRDNYLLPSGCIYPDKCNIQVAALADDDLYNSKIMFWNNVYGFKMNAMKSNVIEEPFVGIVDASKIISKASILKKFDLMKIKTADLDFDEGFDLIITKNGSCSAIVGYFDIFFEKNAKNPVSFSTSPSSIPTHWKQTVFFLKTPLDVSIGDLIRGRMICKKNKKDHRALDIAIMIYDSDRNNILSRQHYVIN